jgi:DNA-binding response OmpR family regulator
MRVLVVDDNVDAANSLALMLDAFGMEVATAHGGRAAVEAARRFAPDAVLLDLGLPDLGGLEVGRQLRQMLGEKVLLVAVTAWGRPEDLRRTWEAGFNRHFLKPADPEQVLKLLSEWCSPSTALCRGSPGEAVPCRTRGPAGES